MVDQGRNVDQELAEAAKADSPQARPLADADDLLPPERTERTGRFSLQSTPNRSRIDSKRRSPFNSGKDSREKIVR